MEDSLYLASSDLPWRASPHAGVEWKTLRFDPETGRSVVLLRFAPGARYGRHKHPGGEDYLVLEGSLEEGGRTWGAGSFVHHPPGSAHRPSSQEGCLLYVTLPLPIEEF